MSTAIERTTCGESPSSPSIGSRLIIWDRHYNNSQAPWRDTEWSTRHIQHVTVVYSSCCPVLPPSSLAGPSVASVYISMQSRYHIDISADIALIPHERFFSGPLCPFLFYFFYFAAGTTGRPISFALNGQVTSSSLPPFCIFLPDCFRDASIMHGAVYQVLPSEGLVRLGAYTAELLIADNQSLSLSSPLPMALNDWLLIVAFIPALSPSHR
jgi:hypothetical protein